jgi:hypothetical protein
MGLLPEFYGCFLNLFLASFLAHSGERAANNWCCARHLALEHPEADRPVLIWRSIDHLSEDRTRRRTRSLVTIDSAGMSNPVTDLDQIKMPP